ncbi:MAG TPA: N-formylglutamate amidohydrolase [Sphingomicrobium sp.]|nr:N-formylglutamate amidohydrolase [Sphingomicrobium sp.]
MWRGSISEAQFETRLRAAVLVSARPGYAVECNIPFAGGNIIDRPGRPMRGQHAVQIEVDRSSY